MYKIQFLHLNSTFSGNIPSDDDKITQSLGGVLHATTTLLKNKAYLFNTLANICIVFFLYAIGPFMLQIVYIKYGADLLTIMLPVLSVLVLGTLG